MSSKNQCDHCHEEIIIPERLELEGNTYNFCCQGCKTVFEIIRTQDLDQYYTLREQAELKNFTPVKQSNQKYLYLDDAEFQKKYSLIDENSINFIFYLEGIHCIACLWLIEKLPDFEKGVLSSHLNMAKSTVEIKIEKSKKLSEVAKKLELLGYPPHPLLEDTDLKKLQAKEEQKDLIRIAISFFCAGNIMLMAFAVYAGAEGPIKQYFDWLSLILFIPISLYSAIPFYKNAWSSLKNKSVSIDLPIVIALILGGIFSAYSVALELNHVYFDTLTILVFLLLLSRFLLKKSQQRGLAAAEVSNFFTNITATKIDENNDKKEIIAKFLNIKDKIEIQPGDTVPADSIIIEGESSVNNSLITGEITPEKVSKGSKIFSGTINISNSLIAEVVSDSKNSKLGKILKSVEKGWNKRTKIITFTDKVAQYFVSTVLTISILSFIYFSYFYDIDTAFIRTLTLIIITCPCALGLATPLSLTLILSKLAKKGILVKDETVIEQASKTQNVFFDKTGTLTNGNFKVTNWKELEDDTYYNIIFNLERLSNHPIAKSIQTYIFKNHKEDLTELPLKDYEEVLGQGPRALIEGALYEIKPILASQLSSTHIGLFKENKLITEIVLKDSIKKDALETLDKIRKQNIETYLLSGDNPNIVTEVGKDLLFKEEHIFGGVKPNKKSSTVEKYPDNIMLGDGANDAVALSHADIGIAVHGSVDISLRASKVFLTNNKLENILKLIISSKETMKLIKRNLGFSLAYNLIGCALALLGHISPLLAAILMPLSSFTVLISTLWGTSELRAQLK